MMRLVKAASLLWLLGAVISYIAGAQDAVNLSVVCMSVFIAADEIINHIENQRGE